MDTAVENALRTDRTIDITTIGRDSGEPRRIEIWFHRADGRYFITGSPGKRDWYANLVANPDFTFHLKGSATADLAARARPITDPGERESVFRAIPWVAEHEKFPLPEWVSGAPLVEVTFTG